MRKMAVHRFRKYSIDSDQFIESHRYGTYDAIKRVGGEVIDGTEIEIDASELDTEMHGFTPRDFRPSTGGGFQREVKR